MSDGASLRAVLGDQLRVALKAGDDVAVAAIRSAMAAIDNAEAVPAPSEPAPEHPLGVRGLGAAEVPRRSLSAAEVDEVVHAEISARLHAAAEYENVDRPAAAARLRAEAGVLERILADAR